MPKRDHGSKSGRVRGLAVSSAKRSPSAPDLPTLQSLYPDFQAGNWYALFVPAGTPAEIITKMNAEILKAIKSPDLRDFMISEGAEPVGGTPQEAAVYFKREMARWAKVIAAGKVTVE